MATIIQSSERVHGVGPETPAGKESGALFRPVVLSPHQIRVNQDYEWKSALLADLKADHDKSIDTYIWFLRMRKRQERLEVKRSRNNSEAVPSKLQALNKLLGHSPNMARVAYAFTKGEKLCDIARGMNIKVPTAHSYLYRIKKRLKVKTNVELIRCVDRLLAQKEG